MVLSDRIMLRHHLTWKKEYFVSLLNTGQAVGWCVLINSHLSPIICCDCKQLCLIHLAAPVQFCFCMFKSCLYVSWTQAYPVGYCKTSCELVWSFIFVLHRGTIKFLQPSLTSLKTAKTSCYRALVTLYLHVHHELQCYRFCTKA